jgi:hypothetical protein
MATNQLYNVYVRKDGERTLSNVEPLDYEAGLRLCQGLNVGGAMTELIPVTNETARKTKATKKASKTATKVAILKGDSIPNDIVVKAAKVLDANGYDRFDLVKLALSPKVNEMTFKQKEWVIITSASALERRAALDVAFTKLNAT